MGPIQRALRSAKTPAAAKCTSRKAEHSKMQSGGNSAVEENRYPPSFDLSNGSARESAEDTQMADLALPVNDSTIERNLKPQPDETHSVPLLHEEMNLFGSPITPSSLISDKTKAVGLPSSDRTVVTLDDEPIYPSRTHVNPMSPDSRGHGSMGTLAPGKWLSDDPVNQILTILTTLGSMNHRDAFGAVSSFHLISNPRDKTVQEYIKQMISANLTLLLPINGKDHWMLGVLYPRERRVEVYESLNLPKYEEFAEQTIDHFLVRYFPGSGQAAWEKVTMAGPRQNNNFDCGVMTVVTAAYLVLGRRIPKRLDGPLWRSTLHCLLQVFERKYDSQDAVRHLERYLLEAFPPPSSPEDIPELSCFDERFEDREYHGDLAFWEQDAALKISKIDEILRSMCGTWTPEKLADEPFYIISSLKNHVLAELSAALPQYFPGQTDQDASEKALKTLAEARGGFRKDLALWQQLHGRGHYSPLTSQGLTEVNAKLQRNKRHSAAVKGYQGVCAVLDAIDAVRKKHRDSAFILDKERQNLQGRRAGLKRLIVASGAPRSLKRKRDWDEE